MIDLELLKELSGSIASEALSVQGVAYAYERNLSEDDKSRAPEALRDAKEAMRRLYPLLRDMLKLIDSELGPGADDDEDNDDDVSEIRTLEDAQAKLSVAVSESSVREALDAEYHHDHFPEDYAEGVDLSEYSRTNPF